VNAILAAILFYTGAMMVNKAFNKQKESETAASPIE